jgi:hypothetical protein
MMENEEKEKQTKNLDRKISFRVTNTEYEKLEREFKKTVYRKFSEYL